MKSFIDYIHSKTFYTSRKGLMDLFYYPEPTGRAKLEEAQWVGLSIKEALEKAERELEAKQDRPLKVLMEEQFLQDLRDGKIKLPGDEEEADTHTDGITDGVQSSSSLGLTSRVKGWFSREK